jgi:3-oxosteroid 1-dehydrogenase
MLESEVGRRAFLNPSRLVAARTAPKPSSWDIDCDVVVVGSGAAGSVAALAAAAAGARVVVLEKAKTRGGLTARSDGLYWIPNNPALRRRGLSDSREDFLQYVARSSFPGVYKADAEGLGIDPLDLALMGAFYDHGPAMVAELERLGVGASEIALVAPGCDRGLYDNPSRLGANKRPWGRALTMAPRATESGGAALARRLGEALDGKGVPVLLGHAVTDVVREHGRIVGVVVDAGGQTKRVRAGKGLVFATGGFLQDPIKRARLQVNPVRGPYAPIEATGDFLPIAASCGAMTGSLASAWRIQGVLNHQPTYPAASTDFALPGDSALVVDCKGRRVLNEFASAHDRARTMYAWDGNNGRFPNLANIYVYDGRAANLFAGLYPFAPAGGKAGWVLEGGTLEALADKIREELSRRPRETGRLSLAEDFVPRLNETIARFNKMAAAGRDEDFARGETEAEQYAQACLLEARGSLAKGRGRAANPYPNKCLHPLSAKGPFYAVILVPSALDSNGGPVIDAAGQVLDEKRRPIPGLFAAGNCVASPARDAFWGPGAAGGLAMTFGMLAGRSAAVGPTGAALVKGARS